MKRKVLVLLVIIISMFAFSWSLPAGAQASEPVNLLSGKSMTIGSRVGNALASTTAFTDGDLSGGGTIKKEVSDSDVRDHLYYFFATPVNISAFKIVAPSITTQTFLIRLGGEGDEYLYHTTLDSTKTDGEIHFLPQTFTGVKSILIRNASADMVINELEVYNISPTLSASNDGVQAYLSWDEVYGATSYNLGKSTNSSGPFSLIAESVTAATYTDTDVINGGTYYYMVTPNIPDTIGQPSNIASTTLLNKPTNLTADPDSENKTISLAWNPADNALSYSVKRSTTQGGPYATIAGSVTDPSYVDEDVDFGVPYFYVVVANFGGGTSDNSNEAVAILEAPDHDRALLTIFIEGGQVKEYDLSQSELNAFIEWYDAKDAGTGPAKYAFNKTWNLGPFKSRSEYVIFDKILTFNVDEYDTDVEE